MITGCSSLPIKKNEWIQSGKSTGMNRRRNDRSRRFFPTGAGGEETRTNIKSGEQYRKPNNLPFENCTSPWYFWKSVPPSPPITHEKKITEISLHSFFVRQIGATDGYWSLCHRTEDWIVPTNAGTVFFVCSFGVTYLVKLRSGSQETPAEPNGITLHVMRNDLYIDGFWRQFPTAELFTELEPGVYDAFYVSLQSPTEIPEHGRPSR